MNTIKVEIEIPAPFEGFVIDPCGFRYTENDELYFVNGVWYKNDTGERTIARYLCASPVKWKPKQGELVWVIDTWRNVVCSAQYGGSEYYYETNPFICKTKEEAERLLIAMKKCAEERK